MIIYSLLILYLKPNMKIYYFLYLLKKIKWIGKIWIINNLHLLLERIEKIRNIHQHILIETIIIKVYSIDLLLIVRVVEVKYIEKVSKKNKR